MYVSEERLKTIRENSGRILKSMLMREPTEEEIEQYFQNVSFLLQNEPSYFEPDYRVVYDAQEALDDYLAGKKEALEEAKKRYERLSIIKKLFNAHPKWAKLLEDDGIDAEFLDGLYNDGPSKGKSK